MIEAFLDHPPKALGLFSQSMTFPAKQPECGRALAAWRQSQNWTQDDMARRAGVPLRTLQNWEAGRVTPRPGAMKKLDALAQGQGQEDRFARIEVRLEKIEALLERILENE